MNKAGLALFLMALLSGCSPGRYTLSDSALLAVPTSYAPAVTRAPTGEAPKPLHLAAWWQQFQDPLLADLIGRATEANLRIAESAARLKLAREERVRARAELLPTLNGSAGVTHSVTQGGSTNFVIGGGAGGGSLITTGDFDNRLLSLGLDTAWQIDLFGGLRKSLDASRAEEMAARFDLEGVRTAIAGEVASNYIEARLAQARLEIARDTLRNQDGNIQIAGWRAQAGLVSGIDIEQAGTQRDQVAATIPPLESAYLKAVARLGVLVGQAPDALRQKMESIGPIPEGPDSVLVGIPADTLRRRPDVRSAERALAAATARIGVARAQLFPALSLSGNLNTQAARVGGLGDLLTGSLFLRLTQAIFDGGHRGSEVRSARANADLAFSTYKQTVLSGLEEVENAVQAMEAAKVRQSALENAVRRSTITAGYARRQYSAGLADFATLLEAERNLLSARDQLASAKSDRATALVRLFLALGGGWQANTSSATDRT